ncbi:hypothetical protein NPIL_191791 [Nephila pilipes]|uniref:Uncharacterized protein n=1 Tax=Nephila pilipes TaxID=299642 RepID=A0A8X6Q090_NEPPI|nr:hypothetical protein NPIL_191791 [Nephila pilipes]
MSSSMFSGAKLCITFNKKESHLSLSYKSLRSKFKRDELEWAKCWITLSLKALYTSTTEGFLIIFLTHDRTFELKAATPARNLIDSLVIATNYNKLRFDLVKPKFKIFSQNGGALNATREMDSPWLGSGRSASSELNLFTIQLNVCRSEDFEVPI